MSSAYGEGYLSCIRNTALQAVHLSPEASPAIRGIRTEMICTAAVKKIKNITAARDVMNLQTGKAKDSLDDSTCRCTVMSFRKADHTHRINELKSAGINCFRINIFDEDTDEIMDILKYVR